MKDPYLSTSVSAKINCKLGFWYPYKVLFASVYHCIIYLSTLDRITICKRNLHCELDSWQCYIIPRIKVLAKTTNLTKTLYNHIHSWMTNLIFTEFFKKKNVFKEEVNQSITSVYFPDQKLFFGGVSISEK